MNNPIPILCTERLILRPFKLADAPLVEKYAGDSDVAQYLTRIPHPYPEGEAETWIKKHIDEFNNNECVNWAITIKDTGEFIGCVGVDYFMNDDMGRLGYWFGKSFWGNGFATEAVESVVEWLFKIKNFNRVYAGYFSCNKNSGNVMKKVGMKHEGTYRKHAKKNGVYHDVEIYGILKSEFCSQC